MTGQANDTAAPSIRPCERNDAVGSWMAAARAGRYAAFVLLLAGAIVLGLLATTIERTLTRSLDGAAGVLAQPRSTAPR